MEEPTNLEILTKFAKSTGRQIFNEEVIYPSSGGVRNYQKSKQIIYIPNDSTNSCFFIWLSDPFAKGGFATDICGAFIPLPSNIKAELNIRKRFFIDKLNPLSKSKHNIGSSNFQSNVVIKGDTEDSSIKNLLSHSRVQNQIVKAFNIQELLNISINEFEIDFIPELKGKPYISIINPQTWCMEKQKIEDIFEYMEELKGLIYNS